MPWIAGVSFFLLAASQARAEGAADRTNLVEVSVRGRRFLKNRSIQREPSLASTVVSGEQLRQPGATSMDVLARVPGVQITRSGGRSDLSTASVRGATSAQTPIYVGGIAINDDVLGTADLSTVPLWLMSRVEVFRGNAPANVDRLGIGGAVLFEPRLPRNSELTAGAAVGSYGYSGQWLLGGAGGRGSAALVGVRREGASNAYPYADDQGTRFDPSDDREERRRNADYRSYDTWAIGRHEFGKGARVTALLNAYDREQGVTGLSVIPARNARAQLQRMLGSVSTVLPCGNREACRLELSTSALTAQGELYDPSRELSSETTRTSSDAQRVVQQVRLSQRIGERVTVGFSATQALDLLAIDQTETSRVRARRSTTRGALNGTVEVANGVTLHALGALDCHGTRGLGKGDACGVFKPSGRLGASVSITPWLSVLGNLGRYVRVPTLGELFGISAFVRGNSDIVPETGRTADLGVRLSDPKPEGHTVTGYFDGFAFVRDVDELIAFRRSSFNVIRPYNVGKARIYGAELEAGASLFDALNLLVTGTMLQPLDVTPGRQVINDVLPFRSRLVVTAEAEAYFRPSWGDEVFNRISFTARLHRRASRYADPAGLVVIPRNTTTDFEVSAFFLERRLAWRTALQNAFDARTFDLVGLPLPGRSIFSSLELTFGRTL